MTSATIRTKITPSLADTSISDSKMVSHNQESAEYCRTGTILQNELREPKTRMRAARNMPKLENRLCALGNSSLDTLSRSILLLGSPDRPDPSDRSQTRLRRVGRPTARFLCFGD